MIYIKDRASLGPPLVVYTADLHSEREGDYQQRKIIIFTVLVPQSVVVHVCVIIVKASIWPLGQTAESYDIMIMTRLSVSLIEEARHRDPALA